MIHYLDIPKTAKTDEGIIRCYARNIQGEAESMAHLRINPKTDYRSVLRNVKTGEPVVIEEPARNQDKCNQINYSLLSSFYKNSFFN